MNLTTRVDPVIAVTPASRLTERASEVCQIAKQLEKAGEYELACEALKEFWPRYQDAPILGGLEKKTEAQVLVRIGALCGWLGSVEQSDGSQERGKNLITRAIELFGEVGDSKNAAEARAELALLYWREGAFDEARINLSEALSDLEEEESDLKASILIRAGIVEVGARRFSDALRLYNEAAKLLETSIDHALRGTLHNSIAVALRCLADVDNLESHLDRALIEYAAAGFHFEQAGNIRYLARVENNLGYLFFKIGRHQEAHKHLNRARLHFLELNDVGAVAQVDDTRARTLLAEGHLREAERFARSSVRTLEKGDEQALVAEALTTHGVALARLGNHPQAKALLQRAIDIAGTAGDLEGAGRAKLSIIEELSGQTTPTELAAIYQDAADLLRHTQDPSTNRRLIQCAGRVIKLLRTMESPVPAAETNSWEGFSFRKRLREFERILIERALQDAGGSVTKASRLLGFRHHQSLISLINTRHTDLLKIRSVVQKRRHHLFSEPKRTTPVPKEVRTVTILHAERDEAAASTLRELCAVQDWQVDYCPNGQAALEKLLSQERFDAMVLDCDLPELSGLELVLRARTMKHRHRIPIIMLSERECEIEAWRAGVDVFLRKPRDFQQVPKIISRLAKTPKGKN